MYVIMLDGFPRADTLRETFGVDNRSASSTSSRVSASPSRIDARANYNKTWLTLASMFNGAYVDRMLVDGERPS